MFKRTILTACALTMTLVATASAGTILAPQKGNIGGVLPPQEKQLQVIKAQLAIKSPKNYNCPNKAKVSGWIFTNKPGKFQYMLARKGHHVKGPYTAVSKKGANGLSMATFEKDFHVNGPVQTHFRILVAEKFGKTSSNWAPMNVYCAKF